MVVEALLAHPAVGSRLCCVDTQLEGNATFTESEVAAQVVRISSSAHHPIAPSWFVLISSCYVLPCNL